MDGVILYNRKLSTFLTIIFGVALLFCSRNSVSFAHHTVFHSIFDFINYERIEPQCGPDVQYYDRSPLEFLWNVLPVCPELFVCPIVHVYVYVCVYVCMLIIIACLQQDVSCVCTLCIYRSSKCITPCGRRVHQSEWCTLMHNRIGLI
jgi:hypothetical protein